MTTYTYAQIEDMAEWLEQTFGVVQPAAAVTMLRSLAAERKAAIQPQGGEVISDWVLVPRTPTAEMMSAGQKNDWTECSANVAYQTYRAMLAAAPPQHVNGDGG